MNDTTRAAQRAATETTTTLPTPRTRHVAYLHQGLNEVYVVVVDREATGGDRYVTKFTPNPDARTIVELYLASVLQQLQDRNWLPQSAWARQDEFGDTMYTCPVIPIHRRPTPTVQELADQLNTNTDDILTIVEQLLERDSTGDVIHHDARLPQDITLTTQAADTIRRQLRPEETTQ